MGKLSVNNPPHDMSAIKNIYRNYQNNKKTIGAQQDQLIERQNRQIRKIIPR